MAARVIEVRKTCESDPDHPISSYFVDRSRTPIRAVVQAMADALYPEAERSPTWCFQVIYRPQGVPSTTS